MPRHHDHADPPPPGSSMPYDWGRFGRHRLRAPGGAIIDLPVPTGGATAVWVATIWPDHRAPGGWARDLWPLDPATGRGWQLPGPLAAGDVIEFGADSPGQPVRWYGIMDSYEVDRWATVQGPYPDAAAAHTEAQRLLALERYDMPLRSEPPAEGQPHLHLRVDRPRRHGRHRHRGGSSPI
jgi:hypothetical protein